MRPSTLLLTLTWASATLAQKAPITSLAEFNKSLPLCAQSVQNQVFAQALGMAPYGCSATEDPTDLVKSSNATLFACICTAARVPLTAPLTGGKGGAAFEAVATAACSMNTSAIAALLAESEVLIGVCMGVLNGTYAGDLSSSDATQMPKASMASGTAWVSSLLLAVGAATLVAAGMV